MKKILIVSLLAVAVVTSAVAQDIGKYFDNDKIREQLSLSDREVNQLKAVWENSEKEIQVATADRAIKASELKRLLVEDKVNMTAVERVLREAMDLEYKLRLAQIQRMVKGKEILGEKRWADLHRMIRSLGEKRKNMDKGGPGPDRPPRDIPPKR